MLGSFQLAVLVSALAVATVVFADEPVIEAEIVFTPPEAREDGPVPDCFKFEDELCTGNQGIIE